MLINSNNKPVRVLGTGTLSNDIVIMLKETGCEAAAISFEQAKQESSFTEFQYLLGISRSYNLRNDMIEWMSEHNLHSPVLIHEKAYVADVYDLGPGTIVYPMSSVLKSKVGRHVLLGASTHIGHNSHVSDNCVFLPYSSIMGTVYMGFNTVLQATAAIGDNINIDAPYVNILPRSFVTKNITKTGTYGGTPARWVNDHGVNTAEYFNV